MTSIVSAVVAGSGASVSSIAAKFATANSAISATPGIPMPNSTTTPVATSSRSPSSGNPGLERRSHAISSSSTAPPITTHATANIHHHSDSIVREASLRGSSADCEPQPPTARAHPASVPDTARHLIRGRVGAANTQLHYSAPGRSKPAL